MNWISFDCFGTLVDWNRGFEAIFVSIAGDRAPELAAAYHRHERVVQREGYRRYRDVTRIATERAAAEIALSLDAAQTSALAARWKTLPVFADTVPALEALRGRGWKLAVLTNCDDDLFAQTQAQIGVLFDEIVTAEQVRSYKPALAHFEQMKARIGTANWVHAACSWFHDIVPASEMGIARIWIDRDETGEDPSRTTIVLPDLQGLPETTDRFRE